MAIAYTTYDTTVGRVVEQLKEKILKSSDWAHLQLSTGTQNTTLASGASAGATSISTNATIPSGSYVVIGNGAANPEVRLTTGVSGAGPYTVTFDTALAATYSSGAAVGVGTYVKATTTRGAQMVIDLADATVNTNRMQIGVYRTHDGTTGVDKLVRYLTWNDVTPATSTTVHCGVSAGKEHIVFWVEGPRFGETSPQNSSYGSPRQGFGMFDIVPYHAGDTVPAVFLAAHTTQNVSTYVQWGYVSRNQSNDASWVRAYALTLSAMPRPGGLEHPIISTAQPLSRGDNKYYVWPFVIVESTDGLRGRLNKVYFAGSNVYNSQVFGSEDYNTIPGTKITYGGEGYTFSYISRGVQNFDVGLPISFAYRANGYANTTDNVNVTMLAIPNGT